MIIFSYVSLVELILVLLLTTLNPRVFKWPGALHTLPDVAAKLRRCTRCDNVCWTIGIKFRHYHVVVGQPYGFALQSR